MGIDQCQIDTNVNSWQEIESLNCLDYQNEATVKKIKGRERGLKMAMGSYEKYSLKCRLADSLISTKNKDSSIHGQA